METIYDYLFLTSITPTKAWPNLFIKEKELSIENILHVAELCIAMLLSNVETKRVFSFLWRVFAKNCQSMKNQALEDALILHAETDTLAERYVHAIELFLSAHPNGGNPKNPRCLNGYIERKKKVPKQSGETSASQAIDGLISSSDDNHEDEEENLIPLVDEISNDEWTLSDEE